MDISVFWISRFEIGNDDKLKVRSLRCKKRSRQISLNAESQSSLHLLHYRNYSFIQTIDLSWPLGSCSLLLTIRNVPRIETHAHECVFLLFASLHHQCLSVYCISVFCIVLSSVLSLLASVCVGHFEICKFCTLHCNDLC